MKLIQTHSQEIAAAKVGIDPKTARRYLKAKQVPSQLKGERGWRTRTDAFTEVWPELETMLAKAPGLEAKTLMEWLVQRDGKLFDPKQLRTLQRRVRDWRAVKGPDEGPVFFPQVLHPGRQSQSDYTVMDETGILIDGRPFPHLLFHFMLPYSRWETISICYTESYETLTAGYELAAWELGAVAPEHRTDNLSAATQKMGDGRVFTKRWSDFMAHFGVTPSRNNPGESHENGSVEKSHDLFVSDLEQQLLLRGGRDFADLAAYQAFLDRVKSRRNKARGDRLAAEMAVLKALPVRRWSDPIELQIGVTPWSTIVVLGCIYSVPSRLIGHKLRALVTPDTIMVLYGKRQIQAMPRLSGKGQTAINYRHVVGHLVRKPGAFANYRFREDLFPSVVFRKAYDRLVAGDLGKGEREYLRVLHLAAMGSESEVAMALELLLDEGQVPDAEAVKSLLKPAEPAYPAVSIPAPDLAAYNMLLHGGFAA